MISLYHSTVFTTGKLVGKTAFTDKMLVGKGYCRPTLSVTESPVGKALSRPTSLCRPTVCWLWNFFPTNKFFSDGHFISDRHFVPTDSQTAFSLPTNFPTKLLSAFPDQRSDRVLIADQHPSTSCHIQIFKIL